MTEVGASAPSWLHPRTGRLTFACPVSLKADLDRYAALRAQTYGEPVDAHMPRHGFYLILRPEDRAIGVPNPARWIDPLMKYLGFDYRITLLRAAAFHGSSHQAAWLRSSRIWGGATQTEHAGQNRSSL